MALLPCIECGTEISTQAPSCPACGAPQNITPTSPVIRASKSRGLAIGLAILLGGLGFHKFYLGKPGMGILYILFCWTFIPAIISLFEGIVMLAGSPEAFDAKYNAAQ